MITTPSSSPVITTTVPRLKLRKSLIHMALSMLCPLYLYINKLLKKEERISASIPFNLFPSFCNLFENLWRTEAGKNTDIGDTTRKPPYKSTAYAHSNAVLA
jgi:ABC-type glycerol-3-phosphate transport system permease component